MRFLYCAIDQTVPGVKGGSVHVTAVAEGLAALGHEVHVLVSPGTGPFPDGKVGWIAMAPPFGAKELRWMRVRHVRRLVATLRPDVIIERYYNFGGEGIVAAGASGAKTVLEVNAPVIDHHGSKKALLDRALLVEPMRRWREHLCARADLIVTPSAAILPAGIPDHKIARLEWGADTDRFHPHTPATPAFERTASTMAIFAGAFRHWHGASHLVRAIRALHERGRTDIGAALVGDGPERQAAQNAAGTLPAIVFTGAVPHADMPSYLASADVGVAPFEVAAHGPLSLGFYWSPLKIFEYMASGLPVVAPAVDRIPTLVGHGREGLLYGAGGEPSLETALSRLTDPGLRQTLGAAGRERAVRDYSWRAHCAALVRAIEAL